jgi:hypothetical protein
VILKISKSSKNDLKSDFVKSSIKSMNTLPNDEPVHSGSFGKTHQTPLLYQAELRSMNIKIWTCAADQSDAPTSPPTT